MGYFSRLNAYVRNEWPALLVIGIGTLIQLFLATRSMHFLLTNLLPDDAFFYFTLARNVVHGLGVTFDGVNPTNGFHPLWLLINVAAFKLTGSNTIGDGAPIHVLLVLSVLMNAVTALFVTRIVRRFTTSPWIVAYGTIVWVLNPFFLYETLNGLEISLALLFFSLFFLLAMRIEEKKAIGGYWSYFLLGFVASLMVLARIDMAMYVAAFFGWTILRDGGQDWSVWGKKLLQFCIGGALLSLWLLWNYIHFHALLTSASVLETLIEHNNIVTDHGTSFVQFLKAIIYNTQHIADMSFGLTGMYALGFAFIGAFLALLSQRAIQLPRRAHDICAALAFFGGFVLLFIANASIRWSDRSWYFVSGEIFLAITVVVVLNHLFPRITHKRTLASILLVLILFSFYVDWSKNLQPSKNANLSQIQMYETTLWMNTHLPPGTRVGTFTPGVDAYFSTLAPVDLDGVVNNASLAAIEHRQLWQYIKDEHIEYISDYGSGLGYRFKSFLGIDDVFAHLTLVLDMFNDPGAVRIYKVK